VISPADTRDKMHIMTEGGLYFPHLNHLDGTAEWNYNYREDRLNELMDGVEYNYNNRYGHLQSLTRKIPWSLTYLSI
jgi:hypothetical protein